MDGIDARMTRRGFVAAGVAAIGSATLGGTALGGCAKRGGGEGGSHDGDYWEVDGPSSSEFYRLPDANPDPENMFGVDMYVNMETIDYYIKEGALERSGAVCLDMRLVDDPAHYEAIGGNSKLSMMLEGFTLLPYPYIGTLQELPVDGAYTGDRLFDVEWDASGEIVSATPRYAQSEDVLEDLIPKGVPVLLMCGGGGYAGMMRKLLIYLGWAPEMVINIGGMWEYAGDYAVQLISYADPENPEYFLWRAKMPIIDFATLR